MYLDWWWRFEMDLSIASKTSEQKVWRMAGWQVTWVLNNSRSPATDWVEYPSDSVLIVTTTNTKESLALLPRNKTTRRRKKAAEEELRTNHPIIFHKQMAKEQNKVVLIFCPIYHIPHIIHGKVRTHTGFDTKKVVSRPNKADKKAHICVDSVDGVRVF